MGDIETVVQLVLRERRARDRAWWDRMRAQYWPDAVVSISWFTGTAAEFVERSAALAGAGNSSVHRMGPVVVEIRGDRALAEASAALEIPGETGGVATLLTSYLRLHYRAERRDDEWRLLALDTIYERDALAPAVPGETIRVAAADLAGFRRSYRLLSWLLTERGIGIADDLLGDDRPDDVAAFYDRADRWLSGD